MKQINFKNGIELVGVLYIDNLNCKYLPSIINVFVIS